MRNYIMKNQQVFNAIAKMSIEELQQVYAAYSQRARAIQEEAKNEFSVGQKVKFISRHNNAQVQGIIDKINRKTIIVKDSLTSMKYKVSPSLLEAC